MLFLFSFTYNYPLLSLTIAKITVMSCCQGVCPSSYVCIYTDVPLLLGLFKIMFSLFFTVTVYFGTVLAGEPEC